MSARTTLDLASGDVLRIGQRVIRTVREVRESGYRARGDEVIYNVIYEQDHEPDGWSDGNSGIGSSLWTLAEQCSYGVGGDPANGCDDWVEHGTDLCDFHAGLLDSAS